MRFLRYLSPLFALPFLTACASLLIPDESALNIVCTLFPAYDWLTQLTANVPDITVTLLCDNGADLHSYQPSVADIAAIQTADLVVAIGGESDAWCLDAARDYADTFCLLDYAETREEVYVEGMPVEEEDAGEIDEHVWLSLRQASIICAQLCDVLADYDPNNSSLYAENCANYRAQLTALDSEYTALFDTLDNPCLIVADRFPFLYLAEDYDINYYAAFQGCDAESEVTFATILTLADKANTIDASTLFLTETGDDALATTIAETAGRTMKLATLYTCETITQKQLDDGVTYLSRMEENYNTLAKAFP